MWSFVLERRLRIYEDLRKLSYGTKVAFCLFVIVFFFGARLKLSDTFLLINTVNVSCQKQSILLKWRMMYLMLMKIKQEKRRKNMKCKWQCLIATNVVTKTFICGFVDFIFKQELVARIVCHPEGNMIFHRIHWLVKKSFANGLSKFNTPIWLTFHCWGQSIYICNNSVMAVCLWWQQLCSDR